MIESFGNHLAYDLYENNFTHRVKGFPQELVRVARRKLFYLHEAMTLQDLRIPPGNRLEILKGNLEGFYSLRINNKWRIVFRWTGQGAADVRILDYH